MSSYMCFCLRFCIVTTVSYAVIDQQPCLADRVNFDCFKRSVLLQTVFY
ncbi:hypothetical protein M758_UG298200 [Ceratodon purpureus]|nr:hypothetical protein M758_UG298200 [Ceratodon purpureus]